MRFKFEAIDKTSQEEREGVLAIYQAQQSLLEQPLKKLSIPEYVFRYQFTSDAKSHTMQLHDWEVEATYHEYKKRYGGGKGALDKMVDFYETRAPAMNAHLIMGTMQKRQNQFIIIGLLRTKENLDNVDGQKDLF